MNDLDQQLIQLAIETCQSPPGSLDRQRGLNRLIGLIQKSQKLFKDQLPDYEDALQQTWIYFCRNLCEATTGDQYDPQRASLTTWINAYLKRRLQDYQMQLAQESTRRMSNLVTENGEVIDPVNLIPAQPTPPDLLGEVKQWLEQEQLHLRRTHIRNHPEANCYLLISRRLPPETSWESLSETLNIPIATLSNFYQRECLPRLLKFGQSQGYLEP